MQVQALPLPPTDMTMKTKITLEQPYNKRWKYGYLLTNRENRKTVILYNSEKDRSTTSYARYMMSVFLKRFLLKTEHVDHIDNDKTNDIIENLQLLSPKENSNKQSKVRGRMWVKIKCPVCDDIFHKKANVTQAMNCHKGKITCCSYTCKNLLIRQNLSVEQRQFISKSSLLEIYRKH